MRTFIVGVVCAVVRLAAAQQCPYVVTDLSLGDYTFAPNTPSYTCVETPPSSNHWVITVSAHGLWLTCPPSPPPNNPCDRARLHVTISGGTTSSSCSIVIDATDPNPKDGIVVLEVVLQLGQSASPLFGNIELVTLSDEALDTALVIAGDSRIDGNLIGLYANAIAGGIFIDGDVGDVYIQSPWSMFDYDAQSMAGLWQITGNLTGVLYVDGRIDNLDVGQDIGSPTSFGAVLVHQAGATGGFGIGRVACESFFGVHDISLYLDRSYLSTGRVEIRGDMHGEVFVGWASPSGLPVVEVFEDVYGHIAMAGMTAFGSNAKIQIRGGVKPTGLIDVFRWLRLGTLEPPVLDIWQDIEGTVVLGGTGTGQQSSANGAGSITPSTALFFDNSFLPGSVLRMRGEIQPGAVLNIAGSFEGHLETYTDAPIHGQIIVNADAGNEILSGTGTLNIDTVPIALQPFPLYANPAAQLGGGAIGAVPFNMHSPDCGPPSGSLINLSTTDPSPDTVRIRHYGPIRLAGSGGLLIEMHPYYYPSGWTPVSFTPTVSVSTTNPRDLLIENGSFDPDYQYRICPNGYVLCDGNALLKGTDVPVAEYTYILHVRTRLDRNMNGLIESGDVSLQITDPIDVNGDGVADILDLMEVIHATGG